MDSAITLKDRALVTDPQKPLAPANWPDDELTIANLGHATLLMNYFGVAVLTDPTLFNRVGFAVDSLLTVGPRRITAPPLPPEALQTYQVI
jgi:hypothetical protein